MIRFNRYRESISLLAILITLLSACSTTQQGDSIVFELNKNQIEENLCLGMYEVEYQLSNGSGYATREYYQLADGRKFLTEPYPPLDEKPASAFIQAELQRKNTYLTTLIKHLANNEDALAELARENKNNPDNWGGFSRTISDELEKKIAWLILSDRDETYAKFASKVGMRPFIPSNKKIITKSFQAPIFTRELKDISKYFVSQSDPNICWAASLETAFRYIGKQYKQTDFVSALKNRCLAKLSKTASVNQMFFAATEKHLTDGGKWIGKFPNRNYAVVDFGELSKVFSPIYFNDIKGLPGHNWTGKSPTGNYSSFYVTLFGVQIGQYEEEEPPIEGIAWETTRDSDRRKISEGKIQLIKSVAELIFAMNDNYPVIAGFKQSQGGHAVVISKIEFRPGGRLNTKNVYELDHRAYLNYVHFLDPTSGLRKMAGDYFLENTAFMFYIDP